MKALTAATIVFVTALAAPAANGEVTRLEVIEDAGDQQGFGTGRWCQVAVAELGL